MRIALVTETFLPEVNGVAMTLGRLVEGLREEGVEVLVVRPLQKAEARAEFDDDVLLVPGLPIPGYDELRMGVPVVDQLLKQLGHWKPDVIHIATEGPLGIAALYVAETIRRPVSSTFHTNFHQYSNHYNLGLIKDFALVYLRIAHNNCGCTLVPTQEMANELASMGFKNTGVLSRGVDVDLFCSSKRDDKLRKEWGLGPADRAYLYVGRIAKEKNIDLAIEAFERASGQDPTARCVVVGGGPELERLKQEHPQVIFAGMRKGEDLARHYASGDVFLFPSVTETYGNVVVEAMASGLAVVCYDYAAGRERISHGENGLLAEFGNERDFIEQVIAAEKLLPEEFSSLRKRARESALEASWSKVISDFRKALEKTEASYRKFNRAI